MPITRPPRPTKLRDLHIIHPDRNVHRVADMAGVDRSRYSRLVAGRVMPRPREARAIAEAWGLSVDECFGAAVLGAARIEDRLERAAYVISKLVVEDAEVRFLATRLWHRFEEVLRSSDCLPHDTDESEQPAVTVDDTAGGGEGTAGAPTHPLAAADTEEPAT